MRSGPDISGEVPAVLAENSRTASLFGRGKTPSRRFSPSLALLKTSCTSAVGAVIGWSERRGIGKIIETGQAFARGVRGSNGTVFVREKSQKVYAAAVALGVGHEELLKTDVSSN